VSSSQKRATEWVLLLLVILLCSLIRFRLREMPLERDEGEYAYAGQLMLQGIPPYQFAYNMKLPGTYAAYAGILALFGQSAAAVHLGLLIVNIATILLVALIGRRLFGTTGALCAGAAYAVLSSSPSVLGFAAHATHFVVLAAVAGFLMLLESEGKPGWLLAASGVFFGTAFIMKQPGAAFVLFGLVVLLTMRAQKRALAIYLAGAAAPLALMSLLLWRAGVFDRFWFWTVSYGSQYGSILSPSAGLLMLAGNLPGVIGAALLLWVLAAVGVFTARNQNLQVLGSFLVFSFLAVSAGFYYRNHYFILLLPALALLVAAAVDAMKERGWGKPALAAVAVACALPLAYNNAYLFRMSPAEAAGASYGQNPFPEAVRVSAYLREHSPADAKIAVLGSEPEIYFYASRHSATGYIYTYGLMEPQKYARRMQDEMIGEIEASRPEYLIYVKSHWSWLQDEHSDTHIFNWAQQYLAAQYEPMEPHESSGKLVVYRRKTDLSARGR
jgi:4-amino-4-deoxy-L-arabinose transferase-like glycosyltransferase